LPPNNLKLQRAEISGDVYLAKTLPLTINAATVSLAIEVELLAHPSTLPEAGAKVLIQEFHPLLPSHLLAHLPQHIVPLIGADKQGGGEGGEVPLPGSLGCP